MTKTNYAVPVSRRALFKTGAVIALATAAPWIMSRTAAAHVSENINRELHLYMGDGYFRSEDFKDGKKTSETGQNERITLQARQTLLIIFHNESRNVHAAYFGRKGNLKERRFEESLFGPFQSVTLEPRGFTSLEITVPDAAGEWEIGDLSLTRVGGPTHYEEGMKTLLTINS